PQSADRRGFGEDRRILLAPLHARRFCRPCRAGERARASLWRAQRALRTGGGVMVVPRTRWAPLPHSPSKTGVNALSLGRGWGWGSEFGGRLVPLTPTPLPNPPPQGGREQTCVRGGQSR